MHLWKCASGPPGFGRFMRPLDPNSTHCRLSPALPLYVSRTALRFGVFDATPLHADCNVGHAGVLLWETCRCAPCAQEPP